MPMISVIIPAYNEEDRIKKCIDSVLNQTYKNIEIIVVNDGSTDKTLEILKEYSDNRLKVFTIKNSGQGCARNYGIKKALGEYITFVDADDYIDLTMIEKLYSSIVLNNSLISICNLYKSFGDKNIEFKNFNKYVNDDIINFMVSHPGPVGRLYKKDLFIDNNIYFLENCIYEDLGTIPLLGIYAKKVSVIDDCLYYYVIRNNSSMNQIKYSKKLEDIFYVMDYLEKEFKKRSNDKYDYVIEYLNIEHLLYSANMRFLKFKEGVMHSNYISDYMKKNYPNWMYNKIYKYKSRKFKIFCILSYKKKFKLCNMILNLGKK